MKKEYNGHRSWNAWNVSLWIGNDESIYNFAVECLNKPTKSGRKPTLSLAVNRFMSVYGGEKTPDGAKYNRLSVKLALAGLSE